MSRSEFDRAGVRPVPVRISDLVVTQGTFRLGPISLQMQPGELTCVIGTNGSGKTTLLRALVGLLRANGGSVEICGLDAAGRAPHVLREIGYVPDEGDTRIPELTASEFWELHALAQSSHRGSMAAMLDEADRLAHFLDFDPPARVRMAAFSHGMAKKCEIIAGLLHDPTVAIFDEPRNGLDPIAVEQFELMIESLLRRDRAVIIATHDLRFAERVADNVVVLDRGCCTYTGPLSDVVEHDSGLVSAFFKLVGAQRHES